jgi:osmoprotectant transport system permease protein
VLAVLLIIPPAAHAEQPIRIGSKEDAEGQLLGEILAQLLEDRGFTVERKFPLGGTDIAFHALTTGQIDVYPEYSGTLEQSLLKMPGASRARMREALRAQYRLDLLDFFGFNDTYAIAVSRAAAERLGLKTISDLARHPEVRFAFSNEFRERADGWPGLKQAYGLSGEPTGISHRLALDAVRAGSIDGTDFYSTEGSIKEFDLVLLEDDRHFFPTYLAAPLVRTEVDDGAKQALEELAGTMTEAEVRGLNQRVQDNKQFAPVAADFLRSKRLLTGRRATAAPPPVRGINWQLLGKCTLRHLELTLIALLAGTAIAIPLGIAVYRFGRLSRAVLYLAGVLQTIPSIALLVFLIPAFGIGLRPAVAALFLYSLLPILQNTATALASIDPVLRKVSVGMGLTAWQRLRYVELPLAAPTILAGIKTAAVINIGTATLAAFIGAGGLGEPIVTGLALNDTGLILQGAIPAALLAVLTALAFELIERLLLPRHLAQRPAE